MKKSPKQWAVLFKWWANLAQAWGAGLGILGMGTLIFKQETQAQNPEFWGSLFVVIAAILTVVSALIEVGLVFSDKEE